MEATRINERLTLPRSEWPPKDIESWLAADTEARPFAKKTAVANWTERHRRRIENAYGQYLAFLRKKGLLVSTQLPAERVTPELIQEYVAGLQARVAPVTVALNLWYLTVMMKVIEPKVDWRWLQGGAQYFKVTARPIRNKRQAVVPAKDLYDLGVELMRTCVKPSRAAASRFRDGLTIAFLATIPLRLSNFRSMQLGTHLQYEGSNYRVIFSANETKTGRPIDVCVPTHLAILLEIYLRKFRPILVSAGKSSSSPQPLALWLNWSGLMMSEDGIRGQIERHTKAAFGHAIWPHLFRDCVATSDAIEDPEHIWGLADILGHATPRTAEKYYDQATSLTAGRRFQQIVRAARDQGTESEDDLDEQ